MRMEVRFQRKGWHGHPGPRAEQMSATTCFLTPVRGLVTLRKQPNEKFMTLEGCCPPSKAACALPPPPPPPCGCLFWTSYGTILTPLSWIRSDFQAQPDVTRASLTARNITNIQKYQGYRLNFASIQLWTEDRAKI